MITILMAAYNGGKYIAEQIESILSQTEQDWKLIIQDDRSSDGTFAIAEDFAHRHPERIRAIQRETPSGSAQNNFFSMLKFADSEYVMFCDDDDVWLPEKISDTLLEMQRLEKVYGSDRPLLVHTDLKVVDATQNVLFDSMMKTQKLDPNRKSLNYLLVQNNVTGCTMMVNRCLLHLTVQQGLPQHAVMHDWWLALIASALGKISFVSQATILYRQHQSNQVGAKNAGSLRFNLGPLTEGKAVRQSLNVAYSQAAEFLDRFDPQLDENQIRLLRDFSGIPSLGKWKRLNVIRKDGFWKSGFFRRCGQIRFT